MGGELQVLLIDDSESDAGLVAAQLQCADERFDLQWCESLATGTQRLHERQFDVVLLDLNLPDSSGLLTCQRMLASNGQVPIVILSGVDDRLLGIAAVAAGAQDYVLKERADSDTLCRTIRYAIERLHRRAAEEKLRHDQQEFNAARQIQSFLLPRQSPRLAGFDIAGACRPAEAVGGDYFDFIAMPEGGLGVVVADVSSHGLAPALIMAGVRRAVRSLAKVHSCLGDLLTEVNDSVCEDTQQHFVTLFFANLHPGDGSFDYAGAGHEAYLLADDGREIQRLESTTYPLGILPNVRVPCGPLRQLARGESLVLLTDGFQEACSACDELFGTRRVLEFIQRRSRRSAAAIIEELFEEVQQFCHPAAPQDDMTAVIVKALA